MPRPEPARDAVDDACQFQRLSDAVCRLAERPSQQDGVRQGATVSRRLDDPESVTEATRALVAGVKTLLDWPLTGYETTRLRRLAARAKPSVIIRFVHRLNGRITDRVARVLATRSDISELIWA